MRHGMLWRGAWCAWCREVARSRVCAAWRGVVRCAAWRGIMLWRGAWRREMAERADEPRGRGATRRGAAWRDVTRCGTTWHGSARRAGAWRLTWSAASHGICLTSSGSDAQKTTTEYQKMAKMPISEFVTNWRAITRRCGTCTFRQTMLRGSGASHATSGVARSSSVSQHETTCCPTRPDGRIRPTREWAGRRGGGVRV